VVPLATALGVTLDREIYFKDTEEFASHIQEVPRPSMSWGVRVRARVRVSEPSP